MCKRIDIFFIVMVFFLQTGCATIIHGGNKQKVSINSIPKVAAITINGETRGLTPATVSLKRNSNYNITMQMDGYQPYRANTLKKR